MIRSIFSNALFCSSCAFRKFSRSYSDYNDFVFFHLEEIAISKAFSLRGNDISKATKI